MRTSRDEQRTIATKKYNEWVVNLYYTNEICNYHCPRWDSSPSFLPAHCNVAQCVSIFKQHSSLCGVEGTTAVAKMGVINFARGYSFEMSVIYFNYSPRLNVVARSVTEKKRNWGECGGCSRQFRRMGPNTPRCQFYYCPLQLGRLNWTWIILFNWQFRENGKSNGNLINLIVSPGVCTAHISLFLKSATPTIPTTDNSKLIQLRGFLQNLLRLNQSIVGADKEATNRYSFTPNISHCSPIYRKTKNPLSVLVLFEKKIP